MNVEDRVKRGGYIPDLDYLHKQDTSLRERPKDSRLCFTSGTSRD